MSTISFMCANFVAREIGYHMSEGWGQGDKATQAWFSPLNTFEERFGAMLAEVSALGFKVRVASNEAHLCCGSAGTYSVLQPTIATQLRDRKLGHLNEMQPQAILSANIGCITHLQSGTALPVRHWVEALDAAWEDEEVRFGPGAAADCGTDTLASKLRQARRPAPGLEPVPGQRPRTIVTTPLSIRS